MKSAVSEPVAGSWSIDYSPALFRYWGEVDRSGLIVDLTLGGYVTPRARSKDRLSALYWVTAREIEKAAISVHGGV